MDFEKIKAAAQAYQADMTRFLRDMISHPSESCEEREVVHCIKAEMEKLGYDKVEIDGLGNVIGWMGDGDKIIAIDSHIDTVGVGNIDKVGAIGKAGFGWEVKIVDDKGNTVPQGTVGELAVKGPGVMTCYYNDPKATDEVLRDGWLYTGDMAQEDADGFIFLVDRKKDVIISGGENLYPVQIEDFLRSNDNIKDVAVIGLPDQRLGEIAAAIVELKPDHPCTEAEIMEFCNQLPRYKRPHKIIFAQVPRNPTGKIEKPRLREMYGGAILVAKQNHS